MKQRTMKDGSSPVFVSEPFQTQPRIELKTDFPTYGLQTQSNFKLLCTYYRIFEYQRSQGKKRPVCFMSNSNLMSSRWANMSHVTFTKSKRKLLELGLIEVKTEDTWRSGKISFVWPTDAGWSKYLKIKSDRVKYREPEEDLSQKKPKYRFTSEDEENAKIWFKALRKFWKGYPGKLAIIGDWQAKREIRSNSVRKAREELGITAEKFRQILITLLQSNQAKFFLENVLGSESINKKWKNEKTVARNMLDKFESIQREQEEAKKLELTRDDLPTYEVQDKPGTYEENVDITNIWQSMWDIIGSHLRSNFRREDERERYREDLLDLCEAIADRLYFRPGRISLKNTKLREDLWNDEMPNHAAYFYFLLDRYSNWQGFFSKQMLWQNWMEFWRRVWKLDHGEPTPLDLQQFLVHQITEGD